MTTITDMRSVLPFHFSLTISRLSEGLRCREDFDIEIKVFSIS